jgi:hypothetical protein
MSGAGVKKAMKEYVEIRTSKDGRQYVTVSDVLNSPAGREEIRKHGEIFKVLKGTQTNGSVTKASKGNASADE